jgi:glycosyltransferase involved in cell wall biosynthesis
MIREREAGLNPDVVVAHSGWGSGTFAKAVWPDAKYVAYVEWYYRYPPKDALGLTKQVAEDGRAQALARNAPTLLDLAEADLVFCPTAFQAAQFPDSLRRNMLVLHDGVDTGLHCPKPASRVLLDGKLLPDGAEVVSYATRGMEPHRGFPEFMRAVAKLQALRPALHVVIGGSDRISYGPKLPEGQTWKKLMLAERELDLSRIHFTGLVPRADYIRLLQATDVHVYLTVPFVLSWSLIEAMSVGCALVASNNEPVREALRHGESAELVDHSDIDALASAISRLLNDRERAGRMGVAARNEALRRYDSRWIWPARAEALTQLVRGG